MEERGFDTLQKGFGPLLLIGSTVVLTLIILLGGLYFRYKEMEWRAAHKDEGRTPKDDSAGHPAG